ncbi:hypothetical protein X942_5823 [Burkholderia pseudomallei MSHR5596]|nr:hypothetical protein X942_5823 [Burkholderia pseudomallei MSHR5596]
MRVDPLRLFEVRVGQAQPGRDFADKLPDIFSRPVGDGAEGEFAVAVADRRIGTIATGGHLRLAALAFAEAGAEQDHGSCIAGLPCLAIQLVAIDAAGLDLQRD